MPAFERFTRSLCSTFALLAILLLSRSSFVTSQFTPRHFDCPKIKDSNVEFGLLLQTSDRCEDGSLPEDIGDKYIPSIIEFMGKFNLTSVDGVPQDVRDDVKVNISMSKCYTGTNPTEILLTFEVNKMDCAEGIAFATALESIAEVKILQSILDSKMEESVAIQGVQLIVSRQTTSASGSEAVSTSFDHESVSLTGDGSKLRRVQPISGAGRSIGKLSAATFVVSLFGVLVL